MTSERLFNSFIPPKNFYTPQNKFPAMPLTTPPLRQTPIMWKTPCKIAFFHIALGLGVSCTFRERNHKHNQCTNNQRTNKLAWSQYLLWVLAEIISLWKRLSKIYESTKWSMLFIYRGMTSVVALMQNTWRLSCSWTSPIRRYFQ